MKEGIYLQRKEKICFVLFRMIKYLTRGGLTRAAAELAFYLLFSLFPMLMVLHSLMAWIEIPTEVLERFFAALPNDVSRILSGYLDHLRNTPFLSPLLSGAFMTLYFLSRAVRSLMHTFEEIYGHSAEKSLLHRIMICFIVTILSMVMLPGRLILIVLSGRILKIAALWFPQKIAMQALWEAVGHMIGALFFLFFLMVCYRFLPGISVRWRDAFPGAAAALVFWYAITQGFALYVDHMARYSLLYGSIGAVIVLMLWLDFSALALIMGAVFNHVLQIEVKKEDDRLFRER